MVGQLLGSKPNSNGSGRHVVPPSESPATTSGPIGGSQETQPSSKPSANKQVLTSSARYRREKIKQARATVANALESIALALDAMPPDMRLVAIAEALRRLATRAANEAHRQTETKPDEQS